jgi:hypothetical protein
MRDIYRATPAVTLGLGFPVSSEGPPHSVASYIKVFARMFLHPENIVFIL